MGPAAHAAFGHRPRVWHFYRRMAGALAISGCCDCRSEHVGAGTWPLAAAFAGAWFVSPAVAFWASLSPRVAGRRPLAKADAHSFAPGRPENMALLRDLRHAGRQHATARQLPGSPRAGGGSSHVADQHRPLSAVGRVRAGLRLDRDPRGRGAAGGNARDHGSHAEVPRPFLNWYDTHDLRPLDPQYVSSVDSGNLAGHLIALANACNEWRDVVLADQQLFQGVADTLDLLRNDARRLRALRQPRAVLWRRLDDEIERLAAGLIAGRRHERRRRAADSGAFRAGRDLGRHGPRDRP